MSKIASIVSLLTLVVSANAYAGSAGAGTLSNLHFMGNGVVILYTSGARTGVPACATTQPNRFAIDGTTAAGKVHLAGVLAAHAAGKTVYIFGTGNCSNFPDTESVNYFAVE